MFTENMKMALASVRAARFRSFLTMLGIIIGVVSVITTISLGEGIKKQIVGQTRAVGADLITVRPGNLVKRDAEGKINGVNLLSFLSSSQITEKDLETVAKNPQVEVAVPLSIINGLPAVGPDQFKEGFVMATSDDMPSVVGQELEYGNFFDDIDSNKRTAVIGFGVAEKLFKENVPLGKTFQIRGEDFIVGGVYEKFPTNPLSPEADFNNGVFITVAAAKTISGNNELKIYEVLVRPKDKSLEQVNQTIANITSGLKQSHAGQEDFTVLRQEEMVTAADSVLQLITKTVTIMAGVALFVGGIGIMNVMLVSVTERTREIGIRKAVGATNSQIQAQFLVEAIVICIWGALIGIFLSVLINLGFRIFTNLEPVITWQAILVSAGASVAIGVIFGMIPAVKASRKDPIESLRSY